MRELAWQADARRPKHERRTTRALHAEIEMAGCGSDYGRVTAFTRAWRQGEGQAVSANAFVPLTIEFGEAFKIDSSIEP